VVEGGIKELTTQCVRNLEQVLHHAGSDLGKVIKVQVFLKDMADFAEMNEVYETVSEHCFLDGTNLNSSIHSYSATPNPLEAVSRLASYPMMLGSKLSLSLLYRFVMRK
jgi:enamine deaminase RidA (YjgF/YER057c/UK114 family)